MDGKGLRRAVRQSQRLNCSLLPKTVTSRCLGRHEAFSIPVKRWNGAFTRPDACVSARQEKRLWRNGHLLPAQGQQSVAYT